MQPNRQSIRKKGWDYTTSAHYFVTINTHHSRALFGTVVNGNMVLSDAGRVAGDEWLKSAVIRDNIELDEFIIMPTHMHGIVRLKGSPTAQPVVPQFGQPVAGALGTFVGAYKAAVTRTLRRKGLVHQAPAVWHRNYWDVIIRDERALNSIRRYIRMNPQNFDVVSNVGEPKLLGNRQLLELPKMGFLASRGAEVPHGRLPLKKGEAIMSGFLSPMERAVFRSGLQHRRPLIWVKPWGLDEGIRSSFVRHALDEGRLLILSPFDEQLDAPNVRRAAWCNQYVIAQSNRLVVGHLNPDGMLACILSEADPEMDVMHL